MRTQMCERLIGKTVSGTYTYDGAFAWHKYTYTIYFVDETYCNIKEKNKSSAFEGDGHISEYNHVPYEITGGVFGLEFNWGKAEFPLSVGDLKGAFLPSEEPFKIDIKDGKIEMYTPNIANGDDLLLTEK